MKNYSNFNDSHICEIPLIQRDYVQGAEINAEKRDNFLTSIFKALIGADDEHGNPYSGKMDFIYGYSEGKQPIANAGNDADVKERRSAFMPIDGQQRLTTLALIGWLLAQKTDPDNHKLPALKYRTRHTTEQFCDHLLAYRLPADYGCISRHLYNHPLWMSQRWLTDPSVKAMVELLDAADRILESAPFRDNIDNMASRFFGDSPLEFETLELPDYNLTEDLYVKMNARGKHLSEFENWKAEFTDMLEANFADTEYTYRQVNGINLSLPEYFSYAIEHDWTNLLWPAAFERWDALTDQEKRIHAYPRIDEQFMAILDFVAAALFKEQYPASIRYSEFIDSKSVENIDPSKRFRGEKGEWLSYRRIDMFRPKAVNIDGKHNVVVLFNILDTMCSIADGGWSDFFEVLLYNGRWNPESIKINIFENENRSINLFEACLEGGLTAKTEALLWGILKYCSVFGTYAPTHTLADFTRVFWGWVLRQRQRNEIKEAGVKNNLRADDYPEMALVLRALMAFENVYDALANLRSIELKEIEDDTERAKLTRLRKSLSYEIEKLHLREIGLVKVTDCLTGCHYLYGDFSNLIDSMETLATTPELFMERFVEFYNKDEWDKARSLISYGWRGEKVNNEHDMFYGMNGHWDYIFTTPNPLFRSALTAMLTGDSENKPTPDCKEFYIAAYREFFESHRWNENPAHFFHVESEFRLTTLRDNFSCYLTKYRQCPYAHTAVEIIKRLEPEMIRKLHLIDSYELSDQGCIRFNKYKDDYKYWIESVNNGWRFSFDDGQKWHNDFKRRFTVGPDGLWTDTEDKYHFRLSEEGYNILLDDPNLDHIENVVAFLTSLYQLL